MNWKRIVGGIIVVALLVAGGYWAYLTYLAPVAEEDVVETPNQVVVDTGIDVVSAEGTLLPVRSANLAFQGGGKVVEILVEEGEVVPAGTPIIRLEATELETAIIQAEAGITQAEASLELANAQIVAAQASVETAQTAVAVAEAQLALAEADPSEAEIASIERNIDTATALVGQAAAQRDLALAGPTEAQIAAAEAQLAAAEAEEATLQAQYDTLLAQGIGGPQETQLRNALDAAKEATEAARVALNELLNGTTTEQQVAAYSGVNVAVAQREAAEAQLDILLAGASPEQIEIFAISVEQAQAGVAQAEAGVVQAQAGVTQAEATIEQAQAALTSAQASLEKMTLVAPFAGTVADMLIEEGEIVAPGIPVVRLADFSSWVVETTDLTELDIVAVSLGQEVEVRVVALPDERIPGRVTDIATTSTLARGDVTYGVTIELEDGESLPLRWGMTAFVDIDVQE